MSHEAENINTEVAAPVTPLSLPAKPVATPENTVAPTRLQSTLGNASLAAAAIGSPPNDNHSAASFQYGHGNAAIARLLIQRKANEEKPSAPPVTPTGPAASVIPATPLIVEDGIELSSGQMKKSEFLAQLRTSVSKAAADAFAGTPWTEASCPYIEQVFAYCATQDSRRLERGIRKYAPETSGATTATALIPIITARVYRALTTWVRTGQVTETPEGVPLPLPGAGLLSAVNGAIPGLSEPDFATRISSAFSGITSLLFKHEHGAASEQEPPDPALVQDQLGAGQTLDAGVRTRMERAFGRSFGDVHVHTDADANQLSKDFNARAFTVGQDVAFAAGQYQPGTLIGDALIAHELAHVAQQTAAGSTSDLMHKGAQEYGALEEDADASAVGAVISMWDSTGELAKLGPRTFPNLRSGLRLQRCGGGSESKPRPELIYDEQMERRGFHLNLPDGEPIVGRSYKLEYYSDHSAYTRPGAVRPSDLGNWFAKRPGRSEVGSREGLGRSHTFTLDSPGRWHFHVEIKTGPNEWGILKHELEVRPADEIAHEKLEKVPVIDTTGFFVQLELQNIQNIQMGLAEQNFGGAYISLEGKNPAHLRPAPHTSYNQYTVHPPTGATPTRYQWIAIPDDFEKFAQTNYHGKRREQINGRDGFNLGAGTKASWPIASATGVVDIYCTIYDQNKVVGEARYRQVVLTAEERKHAEEFQKYMKEAKEQLRELREGTAVYIPAVHVDAASGRIGDLSFFIGPAASGNGLKLIDVTPGVAVREYPGSDFKDVISRFNSHNSYPEGQVRLRIPENNLGIPAQEWRVSTTGASMAQQLSSGWGWASLGLAALGVIAAIVPGTQGLAPVFFFASAGLGAASAGASLYQRSQEAHPSGTDIAVDIASLAGSLIGMAGAANILRHGPRVAALTRTGRFVLYTGFATDAMGGVFIAAQGAEQIAAILSGHGTPEEKSSAVTRILAGLMLQGTLLAWGAKDLKATHRLMTDTLGAPMAKQLSNLELHSLSILEGPALARLAGASDIEEVRHVAELIRQDPVRATKLIDQFGERFIVGARSRPETLEELSQALHVGVPEAAGTRGTYREVTAGAGRPAYVLKPGSGDSSANTLASRIRSAFTNQSSQSLRKLHLGAILTEVPGAKGRYKLTIPADATNPAVTVPVRIEATSELPSSVHGPETGPARMEIRTEVDASGTTRYQASIEVHRDLAQGDIRFAVGHELDELIDVVRRGVRGDDITAQKRASLLRGRAATPGQPAPPITSHDLAEAREFADAAKIHSPEGGRHVTSGQFGMPPDLVERAVTMGFGNTAYLEAKLTLLKTAGVDDDMIRRLRTMAYQTELSTFAPAGASFFNPKIIGHLVHAVPGTPKSPLGGLHLDSALLRHQADLISGNEKLHLLRTADSPRTVGGVTYNAYEQWVWKGSGKPPAASRPTVPAGTPGAKHAGWELAELPKTTVDDLGAFLVQAENAWRAWLAANPGPHGSNTFWTHTLPGGETVSGFLNGDPSGKITHTTVFPFRVGGVATW